MTDGNRDFSPADASLATRRQFLLKSGLGFGSIALAGLLQDRARAALPTGHPHFPAKAKSVIFLFMEGGPSHIDTFDPKPLLNQLAGQKLRRRSFKVPITAMGEQDSPLLACKRQWKQHGQSGLWVSDWFPHVATCADDLCVYPLCVSDGINHSAGVSRADELRIDRRASVARLVGDLWPWQ